MRRKKFSPSSDYSDYPSSLTSYDSEYPGDTCDNLISDHF